MTEAHNIDCMEYMANLPDKAFDLAIVDPPYGIGRDWKKNSKSNFKNHESDYNNILPDHEYFEELFRVSENQIICGGNYYTQHLPPRNSWIFWDKDKNVKATNQSEGELIWTSFNIPMRKIKLTWDGFRRCCERYGKHPHEKPVYLYNWLYMEYAKPGDKILDTHLGSGSSRIAAYDMGFDFVGCELDKDYFEAQEKRFQNHVSQPDLFKKEEYQKSIYEQKLF